MGGNGIVDSAIVWMQETIVGSKGRRGGDLIVLRARATNEYDAQLASLAPFNSVRTIYLGPAATADDYQRAALYVDRAQGVFVAGGDQGNYARWKGTALMAAVQRCYDRGGVIGGISAGQAILGEYAFDAVAADAAGADVEVTTKNAVANPSEPIISFSRNILVLPPLRGTITDSHFVARDRFGRLAVFLSRISSGNPRMRLMGLGIEEKTAIAIDRDGIGTLMVDHHLGRALFIRQTTPTPIAPGQPFQARDLAVTLLSEEGQQYDFKRWCASAPTYSVQIDGAKTLIYRPVNPYRAPLGAKAAEFSSGRC